MISPYLLDLFFVRIRNTPTLRTSIAAMESVMSGSVTSRNSTSSMDSRLSDITFRNCSMSWNSLSLSSMIFLIMSDVL